ncbi:extracellular solute-binding protein [Iocasia frigidifontis]|uniref:Extracellular solute-binding protein n=1 Tax=Iocasia fonsfrigidae TaxID=2682810 RepID=A0A8A7KH65_9FIRM|nr:MULTISPECIES: ABC transporter substrate-binding protein [Halanaerobiaceae]AZO93179.1 carbohydrate ABC transporter substrate-binding protein [Halocella sp. SP3-1]QTL99425.1 extracellular solute-binding protein [Iocasia fonsfrigidae]
MKKSIWMMVSAILLMGVIFAVAVSADETITIMGVWGGNELEAFTKVMETFEAASGIEVEFEGTRDLPTLLTTRLEAGNPPDIVHLTGLGMMEELAREGDLVDLIDVLDMPQFNEDYNAVWKELATYEDGMYGIYISADVKSLVWYNPKAFAAKGYIIPSDWDDMEALMDKMISNGDIPWAIGLESGAASGWPGTDWIEDIMLRTAGPEVYDQWVNHDIPWTDERVKRAFEIFGEIARDSSYVWGGPTAVNASNFGDAVTPLFAEPVQAYMHRQASFITSFIKDNNPDLLAGEDFNFFAFPEIEEEYGTPVLGAADMMGLMTDKPAAKQFMRFLASPGAQSIWVSELGKIGVNKRINPAVYPDELTAKMAEVLKNAEVFRFDGSDSMPKAIGSGAFWTGVVDYVNGQDLDSVLEYIESVADETYTSGAATN